MTLLVVASAVPASSLVARAATGGVATSAITFGAVFRAAGTRRYVALGDWYSSGLSRLPTAGITESKLSWSSYFVLRAGRRCTLQANYDGLKETTTDIITAVTRTAGGNVISQTSNGTPQATLVLGTDGSVRVLPATVIGASTRATFVGFELYPPLGLLSSGGSVRSMLVLTITGTTAEGRQQLQKLVEPGQTTARIEITWEASAAPMITSLTTPAGIFSHVIGVHLQAVAARGLNFAPAYAAQAPQIARLFNGLGGDIETYYAPGVGEVESIAGPKSIFPGLTSKLVSCIG
jgi:hypothetical protein